MIGNASQDFDRVQGVPPVSVVLPVHDGMPFVTECVATILRQTFRNFELVIGDDGSSDGTGEYLQDIAQTDQRIRVFRRERPSGLAAAANWVVAEARAPLIAIAHADDLAKPERLARQVAAMRAAPDVDLLGTLWEGIDEHGVTVRPGDWWRAWRRSRFAPFAHSSVMFRRAAFERVGGYRGSADYWEDLDLYYRMAVNGRLAVIPEVLAAVRHAPISTRLRDDQAKVENSVNLMFLTSLAVAAGADPERAVFDAPSELGSLNPMTFVSCGSTRLWNGRSPATFSRMCNRARLRPDLASLHAFVWVAWGTVSPRSLRFVLRSLLNLRNAVARPLLRRRPMVGWTPFPATRRRTPVRAVAVQDRAPTPSA